MKADIGFIGFGRMAEALWSGIIDKLASKTGVVFDLNPERLSHAEKAYALKGVSLTHLLDTVSTIFICVKPQQLAWVLDSISKNINKEILVVSIVAGKQLDIYEATLGIDVPIIRVMPNTPALLGVGMSAIAVNKNVSNLQKKSVLEMLASVGQVLEVTEPQLDAVTGISGSGPAVLYKITQAMAVPGIAAGLSEQEALKLAAQTMIGAGHMVLETGCSPEELVQQVASPNGTTVAALSTFEALSGESIVSRSINSAVLRAKELSKEP